MQDAFREVLRDIVYRRWLIAKYYWASLSMQVYLYGCDIPDSLRAEVAEAEDLMDYLEADPLFSPNRSLPIHACTLQASS